MCGIYLTITQHDIIQCDCSNNNNNNNNNNILPELLQEQPNVEQSPPVWLLRRGPDVWDSKEIVLYNSNHINDNRSILGDSTTNTSSTSTTTTRVTLYASVLQMRDTCIQQPVDICDDKSHTGSTPTATTESSHSAATVRLPVVQPPSSSSSTTPSSSTPYLAWNGEIYEYYNINTHFVESNAYRSNVSDTELLRQLLSHQVDFTLSSPVVHHNHNHSSSSSNDYSEYIIKNTSSIQQIQQQIATVMGQLTNAEYAFCIVTTTCIYYGRDRYGRRSLLTTSSTLKNNNRPNNHTNNNNSNNNVNAVDTTMVSSTSMTTTIEPNTNYILQWQLASVATKTTTTTTSDIDDHTFWQEVEPGLVHVYPIYHNTLSSFSSSSLSSDSVVSISDAVHNVPPISIDVPTSITTTIISNNSKRDVPRLLPLGIDETSRQEYYCQQLFCVLLEAVRRRCSSSNSSTVVQAATSSIPNDSIHPEYTQQTSQESSLSSTTTNATSNLSTNKFYFSSTAILFSGGLDSTVIAALALEAGVSELTLLTVSFIDHRTDDTTTTTTTTTTSDTSTTTAADAIAAKQSYNELCRLYPHATIHFIHRVVDWESVQYVEEHVRMLAYPKTTTVMDVNIATALWFAASADTNHDVMGNHDCSSRTGCEDSIDTSSRRQTPRILLSGLGADELMGGYGRHRAAYNRGGYDELHNELQMDMNRLWERNLGRDDRILSDTSKEVRFPFLDPNVVQLLHSIPLQYVVDYTLDGGVGDKRILRLIAEQIGLTTASGAVKRAIQFGSRISHVSDKRRYGSRRKANANSRNKSHEG